jgi:hypothetical protein
VLTVDKDAVHTAGELSVYFADLPKLTNVNPVHFR